MESSVSRIGTEKLYMTVNSNGVYCVIFEGSFVIQTKVVEDAFEAYNSLS